MARKSIVERTKIDDDEDHAGRDDDEADDDDDDHDDGNECKIKELQNRLLRRNELLDVVRKAYHRDVLTIKECILRQQKESSSSVLVRSSSNEQQELLISSSSCIYLEDPIIASVSSTIYNQSNNEKDHRDSLSSISHDQILQSGPPTATKSSLSLLSSIPSIDLRHEGLHLFSPQECELRMNPCIECGGYFEVVHRESSRYDSLRRHRDESLIKIRNLEVELKETVQSLERKDQEYIQYEQRTKGKEGMYHAQIQKLKDQVADHNELAETSKNQSIEIRNLNQRCDEKEKTIQLLDMVKVDLANVKQEHKQSKKSIQSVEARNEQLAHEIENGLTKEKSYKDTIGKLENEKGNLKSEVNGLESRLTYKDNELDKCSAEIKRTDMILKTLSVELKSTRNELKESIAQRDKSISNLSSMNSSLKENIYQLEAALKDKKQLGKETNEQFEKRFQELKAQEEQRAAREKNVEIKLMERIDSLMNLTSSYIQSLYEQCLVQEDILMIEDPSLLPMAASHNVKMKSLQRQQPTLHMILERLVKKIDSNHIDWEGLLQKDEDRRIIFGNLNNRAELNTSHIDTVLKKNHAKHSFTIKQAEIENDTNMKETCSRHYSEIDKLRNQIKTKDESYLTLKASLKENNHKLTEALSTIDTLKGQISDTQKQKDSLDHQVRNATRRGTVLNNDLAMIKLQLREARQQTSRKDEEIEEQTETLNHLESVLQKTTERFAVVIENERMRKETNVNIGLQTATHNCDFTQQANFFFPMQRKHDRRQSSDDREVELIKNTVDF